MKSMEKLLERCWSAASKLESVALRNKDLPKAYGDIAAESFLSLQCLKGEINGRKDGPWRVSGKTEDGRMYKVSNRDGWVVCHVFDEGTANLIVALSHIWSGGDR